MQQNLYLPGSAALGSRAACVTALTSSVCSMGVMISTPPGLTGSEVLLVKGVVRATQHLGASVKGRYQPGARSLPLLPLGGQSWC